MNTNYFLCIDDEPVMGAFDPLKAVCVVATFGNGDWILDKISGPFDTKRKARMAAKREAIARCMPAYDTTTNRPTAIY